MFARRLAPLASRQLPAQRIAASRSFHKSAAVFVKVGDSLPDLDVLVEGSPGNKVNLAKELKGKGVILGVISTIKLLSKAGEVFVVSVNDPFVMKAWGATLDPQGKSGVRFLGDPTGKFTEALDLSFDASSIFGGPRSKRYALVVEDGKVKSVHVEPDNTGVDVSAAEKVLG